MPMVIRGGDTDGRDSRDRGPPPLEAVSCPSSDNGPVAAQLAVAEAGKEM